MNYFTTKYRQLAARIYNVGRVESERHTGSLQYRRGIIGSTTFFEPGGEINNLSGNPANVMVGAGSRIAGLLMVYKYGGKISIGDHCSISEGTRIISVNSISIGNRVLIAHNVNILDNISHPLDARERHLDFLASYSEGMKPYDLKAAAVMIEDDAWIGMGSTILRGVVIGRGAVIGAGSMVTKNVEPWTINAGNPLKCVHRLSPVDMNLPHP